MCLNVIFSSYRQLLSLYTLSQNPSVSAVDQKLILHPLWVRCDMGDAEGTAWFGAEPVCVGGKVTGVKLYSVTCKGEPQKNIFLTLEWTMVYLEIQFMCSGITFFTFITHKIKLELKSYFFQWSFGQETAADKTHVLHWKETANYEKLVYAMESASRTFRLKSRW